MLTHLANVGRLFSKIFVMNLQEEWDNSWGDQYGPMFKCLHFARLFRRMFENGELGENVVDIGSGMHPMTSFLPNDLDARVISVDRSGGEGIQEDNGLKLKFNLDDIDQKALVREKISKVADFLDIDQCESLRQIDCFVFSDILNYVDYKKVILFLKQYLRKEGRLLISEKAGKGYQKCHSPLGYDGPKRLYKFLKREGFVIERDPTIDYTRETIIVARLDA